MVCESVIIKVNDICFASSHYPDLPVDDDTSCAGRKARDIKYNKINNMQPCQNLLFFFPFYTE